MDSIVLPLEFDASNITYSEPRILDNGGKVIYVSYNKKKLIIQTPEMDLPFGLSKWNNEGKAADKYSMDLSFKGKDGRDVLGRFFDNMKNLDGKLVDDGLANCRTWFKTTHKSRDVVDALYTPLVKYSKDKNGDVNDKYPPNFKVTVPHNGTTFTCDVYDDTKKIVDLSTIETKGGKCSAIVQCVGIWIAGVKFGCSWKVLQMKVSPPTRIKGYAFKDICEKVEKDIDEDDEDVIVDDEDAKDCIEGARQEDEEEEVIESDEEDDLEVKPKPPVKKVVKK
jgi:hypothetical protein